MKTSTLLGCLVALLSWVQSAQAQIKPAPKPAPAAVAAVATATPPALITDKMADPTPNKDALKVRAEANPLTKRLTVRSDATGPTRVEINATDGRPVITRDLMSGADAVVLDISSLPAGSYLVQCSSGERRGVKRVMVGQ
ncbi:T9SS type A sorting domain-containing protein [Hymenobacter seoulensis]